MKIFIAFHYLLAGMLMWRLLREWGLNQTAGMFGALVWMASGYLVSLHLNPYYLAPAVWVSGLIFCFHRLLNTRRLRWFIVTGLVWAVLFLAGDPQLLFLAGILMLLYLGLSPAPARLGFKLHLPVLASLAILTVGLMSAQLLTSLELGAGTTLKEGYNFAAATQWSHHPLRLLEWLWPGIWGPVFPPEKFWGRFLRGFAWYPWATSLYLGLFPLFLAWVQIRPVRNHPTGFLALSLALFFLMALGFYSPLYRLVWAVFPPYHLFRYPEKHLAIASFALAGLAGLGFQRITQSQTESGTGSVLKSWTIWTIFLTLAFVMLFLLSGPVSRRLADYLLAAQQFSIETSAIRFSLLSAGGRTGLVALAFLVVLFLNRRLPRFQNQIGIILLGLSAADILSFNRGQFITADPSLYASVPAAVRLIRQHQSDLNEQFRLYRANEIPLPEQLPVPSWTDESESVARWAWDTLIPNLPMAHGFEDLFGYGPAVLERFDRFNRQPLRVQTLQMLNVKYLLDGRVGGEIPAWTNLRLVGEDRELNLAVLLNEGYFPRAFFVDGVFSARDEADFLNSLLTQDFRAGVTLLRFSSETRSGRFFVPARVTSYRPREVVVEVNNPVSGHLVLSDSYFPGWEARVDGRLTRVLRANYLVRAVALTPGEHRIVFRYRPWSWRIGHEVSLVFLGFPLLLGLIGRKSGRTYD